LCLVLNRDGALIEVKLPEVPPDGLLREHLTEAYLQLGALPVFPPATGGAATFRASLGGIPFGEERTYGSLALELGTSPRAVASRCAANRLLLRIPCHRVVGRGNMGGFRCGLAWKLTLLNLEKGIKAPPALISNADKN
jgi:O-6-methylguanine DNA methyltransferase